MHRIEILGAGPGDHHQVFPGKRDAMLVQTEEFPDASLDTVSAHGGPVSLLNDQTQSMVIEMVDGDADTEVRRPQATAFPLHPVILGGLAKSLRGPQAAFPGAALLPVVLQGVPGLRTSVR